MSKTRDNHYVPQWYQRGFLLNNSNKLHYLDLTPDTKQLHNGHIITMNGKSIRPTSRCFYQTDLYTTFLGKHINDEIERILFGKIDDSGAKALRAFISEDIAGWYHHFTDFFLYMNSQKIRTPKGLDWIKKHYPNLTQIDLMMEMQNIRTMHCTLWTEGVREIVTATNSNVKFIITDHPITAYNYAYSPEYEQCAYPNEPSIALKATQTIFPLDKDHCLILTNLEYAQDPVNQNPTEKRTNARFVRNSMVKTDEFMRTRRLNDSEVATINLILKRRARRYIAAPNKDWLFPENHISYEWPDLKSVLLPPANELHRFGGEIYAGYEDGTTYYQDAFGRASPENKYLRKNISEKDIGRNDPCGCGSGNKYKKCCMNKSASKRTTWEVYSIRERNLILYNGVEKILGFNKGKTWDDVKRELSNKQIIKIYELYGSLWPLETDIFSLLPRPDGTLRTIYTGMLDPRIITITALGSTPYFDETLIQHPFVNPRSVNPGFSPVDSPHQHKHQTLKNLLLFLYLQPFVEAGVVNFIPDPCSFDNHLHREMMRMAERRRPSYKIGGKEAEQFKMLHEQDFARTIRALPKEQKIHQIRRAIPGITQDQIDEVLEYMREQNEQDPLALLQEDIYGEGRQLMMSSMTPNFEMVLFIAQATGSAILTDSETRWKELKTAQFKENGNVSYPWAEISKVINTQKYFYNAIPETSYQYRMNGDFGNIRKSLRAIFSIAKNSQLVLDDGVEER